MIYRRMFGCLLALLLMLSIMPILVPPAHATANSQTYWEAPLPSEDALLNQTLTTSKYETYEETALSANLYVLQKDWPQPGQYELAIAVVAATNSRHTMGYSINPWPYSMYMREPPNTLSLGDNEGAWVNADDLIDYFGAYYNKVFITSNGFIVLDQRAYNDWGGKWTSPNPKVIPSTDDPNILIAPFWRDLDPSAGGIIKYGTTDSGFAVLWKDVPNKANGNTQDFGVLLTYHEEGWGGGQGLTDIFFVYREITNDVPTSIGLEDQTGKRGSVVSSVSSNSYVKLLPESDNRVGIKNIKVSASKFTDSGINDDQAIVRIDGLNGSLPGGVNVILEDPSEGKYGGFPILSAASFAVGTLGLATGNAWLGIAGFVLSATDLASALSSMPSSTMQEAYENTQTAFIENLTNDEHLPYFWPFAYYPWDASIFALFRWRLLDSSVNHRLVINLQVDYENIDHDWFGYSHTLITDNLELKLTPGSVGWYGRTNPDAHYYNFYQISTPYGIGYHIDTIGSHDYGYQMLGWSKLTDDTPEDYKVGADGKIRVKGYFRQSDTMYGERRVNIYVMYSENINRIVKTVQVLDYTDGTDWIYRGVTIDGLLPGKSVKIGVGRPDSWWFDYELVCEWAGIEVYQGESPPVSPSTPSGPTSGYSATPYSYSTSTTDPDGDDVRYQFDWGEGTTTTTDWYASGSTASASHAWGVGTFYVKVRAQDFYGTWSGWSSSLAVTLTSQDGGGGGGCPYISTWNGSAFVLDNNLLLASESSGGVDVTDYYMLQQMLALREDGTFSLLLSEFENEHGFFDQAQLLAIDHASNVNVGVSPNGEILTYTNPHPPKSAVDNNNQNVKSILSSMDGNYYEGQNGSYIILNFGDELDASHGAKLVLKTDLKPLPRSIHIQIQDFLGNWNTVATLSPRSHWSTDIIDISKYLPDAKGNLKVRLYFTANHKIDFVGLDTSAPAVLNIQEAQLVSAIHFNDGDVTSQLLFSDETYAELVPGQAIMLTFTLPTQTMEARNYIIMVRGRYYTVEI